MLSRNLIKFASKRCASTVGLTQAPKYPPILDLSEESEKIRQRKTYADKYNSLDTVEEKLFYKNLQHYYGTRCFQLSESDFPVDFLPFVKYSTRSRIIEADENLFRQLVQFDQNEAKDLLERIRPYLQEAILFELLGRNRPTDADGTQKTAALVERINDVLLSSLATQYQHLLDATVDYSPRVEAFWLAGNFHPSVELFKEREKKKEKLEEENNKRYHGKVEVKVNLEEPVEHHIQYTSHPLVALRSKLPLPQLKTELINENEPEFEKFLSSTLAAPSIQFGFEEKRRFGTNLPGFWPGDPSEFGLLSYHHLKKVDNIPKVVLEHEKKSRLASQSVLNGFSLLHAQASFLGFSTFSELTYPLASQQVMTDGRLFAFSLYQLNTTIMHKLLECPNTRTNVCAILQPQPLYQEIQANNFIGWNDSVILNLLAFYLNKPIARDVDMKPYINPAISLLSDIKEDERRIWLHDKFRHMYTNRPRAKLGYEIYDWERIYKIEFETRPMEARKRPFERDCNPAEERKYWDHGHPYIPKKFRENPKKKHWNGWRAKLAKSYYPDP